MDARGRRVTIRGSANYAAKLTEDQVAAIKHDRGRGVTQQALADRYGVSRELIREIVNGRAWSHIQTAASSTV